RTKNDLAHVRGIGEHSDDGFAARGDVPRIRGRLELWHVAQQRVCVIATAVVDNHVKAGLGQIADHGLAHDAKADETNRRTFERCHRYPLTPRSEASNPCPITTSEMMP